MERQEIEALALELMGLECEDEAELEALADAFLARVEEPGFSPIQKRLIRDIAGRLKDALGGGPSP